MIEAIIFDFDGLILETEGPAYQSWREVYEAFNCQLQFEDWSPIIGADPNDNDPFIRLEARLGRDVDRTEVGARLLQRKLELVYERPIMPGVLDYLSEARQLGLKIGLASSSSYAWVGSHLSRLGLLDRFDVIRTNDDVKKAKPAPDLFLSALQGLSTTPERAISFEDSYNGILSARSAGIFCVAVPNEMTRSLPLDLADLRIDSLAALPLKQLIEEVEQIKARI
jgi:HAD superfamily hydrolase (TIGR01509 family)